MEEVIAINEEKHGCKKGRLEEWNIGTINFKK